MSRRIGLELRKNLKRLIPRDEMVELEKAIKIAVVAAGPGFQRYHSKAQKEDGKELLPDIVDQLEKHKLIKLKPEERDYRVWREKYLEAGVKDVERLHEMNL
ncbi:hypothetical protein Rt10032_c07g3279 [Rhodotorula toruloides]|uniref:Uncharacterized protein n=1 Tax=Rhodotorula toruloides TaxID=5286 RepID=A0A511KFY0_RHOTO|nr:hypothetical protein Rt10032_c07g3279 [Rhodotorula toruloides]